MRYTAITLILVALLATLGACVKTVDKCYLEPGYCPTEGITRCATGLLEICAPLASGCFVWDTAENCGENRTCTEVTDEAAYCACTNPCTGQGDTWCVGETLYGCAPDDRDCYIEQPLEVCPQSGEVCDETLSPPGCAAP